MVFIAPAGETTLRSARFEPAEKKLLRQTVPYSLEDELAEDVDRLHFALGEPGDGAVDVAIVRRDRVEAWKSELESRQLDIQAVFSELQLLPLETDAWTLVITEELWLVRYGPSHGFAMDPANAGLALQLLLDESEHLPQKLLVFAGDRNHSTVLSQLPELLRGVVEWRDQDYWHMVASGAQQTQGRINLLQGEYAQKLPWRKWWRTWKVALIVLAAVVVLNILMTFVRIQVLESRNLELRQMTEQAYRSAVPRGAVMQPESQLRRKVEAMRTGGGGGFITLFDRVAVVLSRVEGLELQSINYSGQQNELRLTIIAREFNDVETVRSNLESEGLSAELTGSNADGDKTRARLRIRG